MQLVALRTLPKVEIGNMHNALFLPTAGDCDVKYFSEWKDYSDPILK